MYNSSTSIITGKFVRVRSGDETGKKGKGVNYSTQLNLNGSSRVNTKENKRELYSGDFPLLIRFLFIYYYYYFIMEIHI